jgi:hypothetical protein
MSSYRRILGAVFGLVLFTQLASVAQTSTATLTGTIRDASGANLPGVMITVTNMDRNTPQTLISNDAGNYVVPALVPGTYSVMAELPGFKKFLREEITLQVNQTVRVDIELSLGGVSETVEVTAAVSMVETETSSRGSVIDEKKIVELPLNGRDYNQLALLSPGVHKHTSLGLRQFQGCDQCEREPDVQ